MEIKQKKRDEISAQYKWRLEDIFSSQDEWQKAVDALPAKIAEVTAFQGKLTNGENILACFKALDEAETAFGFIFVYGNMKLHEDTNISASQGMADVAQGQMAKFYAEIAFIDPEILSLDEKDIKKFIAETPGLELYDHFLDSTLRRKAHVLSTEIEAILASSQEVISAPSNIRDMLADADLKFGNVEDEDGNNLELTHGRYLSLLQSKDRSVRENAFNMYYDGYWKMKNTLAALLNSSIKGDIFIARTRKYDSARSAALSQNNIPLSVYDNLISAVHEYLPVFHRYLAMRKKALKLDELHIYDLYCPYIEEADTNMPYEEAKKKLIEGLAPLGKDYLDDMAKGIDGGWIDVYENEGKNSGAYSWGSYGTHPYVLMNYEDKLGDLFTFAHEMGHAMHSYYTRKTQPKVYGNYPIFLAEVASTVNETLLMEHMLKTTDDKNVRAYLIGEYLDQFRTTVFRQTMFAEFEMILHSMAEEGKPLTLEVINKIYRDLNVKYYGADFVVDEKLDLEWARISHFYRAFYVYQYATGYSAAIAFTKRIKEMGEPAVKDYLGFLKSGNSEYPIDTLKKAGVDMESPTPVRDALKVFEELVVQLEKEYA